MLLKRMKWCCLYPYLACTHAADRFVGGNGEEGIERSSTVQDTGTCNTYYKYFKSRIRGGHAVKLCLLNCLVTDSVLL
jgi:hypothetical protein